MEEKQEFVRKMLERVNVEGRVLKFKEEYFDFDFGLFQNPTSETENKEQMNDVYYNVLQMIMANPAINLVPAFREYVEKNGITPFHLTMEQTNALVQGQGGGQAGGQQIGEKKDSLSASIDTET